MYKLCFYVPPSHLEPVKQAVFAAGGGLIGAYDCCCWQVLGQGQFRPLVGSQPFIGQTGQVEHVAEWKVELVVADRQVRAAVIALLQAHPYETPAYEVWRLADIADDTLCQ
ncbi:MAG TPA: YqfO family protein [Pseudomonas sp.]|nr:YqfO family protein [Pseudomonas sp.]